MITNNPYNTPQMKHSRLSTDMSYSSSSYRNQSIENIHFPHRISVTHNHTHMYMKKSSINMEDMGRPPHYPRHTNGDQRKYVGSPKNGNANINSFNSSNSITQHLQPVNTNKIQRKESINILHSPRSSFGNLSHGLVSENKEKENQQILEKIENLNKVVKANEKRIGDLEKNPALKGANSKLYDSTNFQTQNKVENYRMGKFDLENLHLKKIKDEILQMKEQITKFCSAENLSEIITLKVKEIQIDKIKNQSPKKHDLLIEHLSVKERKKHEEEIQQLRKQIESIKKQIQIKQYKKNHLFEQINVNMKSLSAKLQQKLKSKDQYKTSGIKSSSTAKLFHLLQNFKIEKPVKQPKAVKIEQNLCNQAKQESLIIGIGQISYYIDEQGFVLDQEKCYILDRQNLQVKLEEHILLKLRQEGIII